VRRRIGEPTQARVRVHGAAKPIRRRSLSRSRRDGTMSPARSISGREDSMSDAGLDAVSDHGSVAYVRRWRAQLMLLLVVPSR
jgi:hypothetical protein